MQYIKVAKIVITYTGVIAIDKKNNSWKSTIFTVFAISATNEGSNLAR